ncbi:uncharacterized protein LOC134777786 [Penaeus indicus]|uniref:uncharacterized protein LOC134777786 n=1 Tax=Penaeus indicus TaxID=29960 RepID=UPI00300D286E
MSAKKWIYLDEYIRFEFVSLQKSDTEVPQFVICYKTLASDGMPPSRLGRHLRTSPRHPLKQGHSLKQAKLDAKKDRLIVSRRQRSDSQPSKILLFLASSVTKQLTSLNVPSY